MNLNAALFHQTGFSFSGYNAGVFAFVLNVEL